MTLELPTHAVIIPGTGSDEVFIRASFAAPLATLGIRLVAPAPQPGEGLIAGYLAALDAATHRHGTVLAGGVSLGAHVAASWALGSGRCGGLLAVLPGWLGDPGAAPAAVAARAGADHVAALGTAAALDNATDGVPPWLAGQLRRAWPRYGDHLATSLRTAATSPAPDPAALGGLRTRTVVVGCTDDPVHPVSVAREWAAAVPGAVLRELSLADIGADLTNLGAAAVSGLG